ncbi:MAG: hypothetical protein IKR92_02075 [Alphaproteobacteria bacterium]|nr:hypothetical protein [Alphaproteobacteria bacterium]
MAENKKAEGLKFLVKLNQASAEPGKLLELARDSIRESHDHRTFSGRSDLIVNADALDINKAYAYGHAVMNANFSTNDKLYLIMYRYVQLAVKDNPLTSKAKALAHFCKEFAAAYPQEYGVKSKQKVDDKSKAAPLLMMKSAQNHSIV